MLLLLFCPIVQTFSFINELKKFIFMGLGTKFWLNASDGF